MDRATARADELDAEELVTGKQQLAAKVQHYQPRFLAVLGISAYRTAFNRSKATNFGAIDFGFWIEEALSVGALRLTICSPAKEKR